MGTGRRRGVLAGIAAAASSLLPFTRRYALMTQAVPLGAALMVTGKPLGVLHEAAALLLATLLFTGEFLGVLCDLVHESSPPSSGRSCRPSRMPRPASRRWLCLPS